MGYSNITIYGSDLAADAFARVADEYKKAANRSVKHLRKELKDMGNEYNTAGPVNVAMILTESPAPHDLPQLPLFFAAEYPELLQETIDALQKFTHDSAEFEWEDLEGKKFHMTRYRALLRKLAKKLEKVDSKKYEKHGFYAAR